MNFLPLRLPPGADLRRSIEAAALPEGAGGAFVASGIGSLVDPRIRLAGAAAETVMQGDYELLSLSGSVTRDGAHLHLAVADARGRVTGGHLVYGNEVRTTAEVLLVVLFDWTLSREQDPRTGFKELVVRAGAGTQGATAAQARKAA